jgi:glutamate 5-kinase
MSMTDRKKLGQCRRWVVKVGSSLLTNDGQGLDRELIAGWVAQIAALRAAGVELVLVSSGAVSEGMVRMGWSRRPRALHDLQAAAAIGQMGLIQTYEAAFQRHGLHTAQILLTHEDLSDRKRYLNARSTLTTLLRLDVIPVVNENDTVAIQELRFGDNDTALVANLVEAELLVLLTDQPGMYEQDPRTNPDTSLIREARADDDGLERMAGSGGVGRWGSGGMLTKVRAARRAARSGAMTIIADGRQADVLQAIASGNEVGTLIVPARAPLAARKQWLAGHLQVNGSLVLDDGAVKVLTGSGRSLLAVGVTEVCGEFRRGDLVACMDAGGREVARGLVNYDAAEAGRIAGQPSDRIEELLGYIDEPELIHRDNLVLL